MSGAFAQWETRLEEVDQCPWPGPRPLREAEPSLLIGRDDDARRFGDMIDSHRLVILDGKSGVGKTSLLQAKLLPYLRADRYIVASCNRWTDDQVLEAHDFLALKVKAALKEECVRPQARISSEDVAKLSDDANLFEELERDGRKFVIILDQFEELIRYSEARTRKTLETLLTINRHFELNIVISLRSEYLHELRQLERGVKAFSYSKFELESVDPKYAKALIMSAGAEHIDDDAAGELAELWISAAASDGNAHGELFGGVGLLHLQAVLYSLHANRSDPDGPITTGDLEAFRKRSDSIFAAAMIESVEIKLRRCEQACEGLADPYLLHGVRTLVARCAPNLSSAGYKLHLATEDLALKALEDEIRNLDADGTVPTWRLVLAQLISSITPRGAGDPQPLGGHIDLLEQGWKQLATETIGDLGATSAEWQMQADSVVVDQRDPCCGPMMGLHPGATLVEELRRFAFSIAWMERSSLIRLSTPAPSVTMISLIHDRFGEGLNRWSRSVIDHPAAALYALTAPKGADFWWKLPDNAPPHALLTGGEEHRILPNLRWRGAFVAAEFRRVLFFNCDFRGTMFSKCLFEGVACGNCLLDGAMFDHCRIVGGPAAPLEAWSPDPSRFEWEFTSDAGRSVVRSLAVYRGMSDDDGQLYSNLPGLPAVPLSLKGVFDPGIQVTQWEPPSGGLVIYGGRVSTMIVRSCIFSGVGADVAKLALRYMAGSGFDVVEQNDFGAIEIHGSVVRHVTFSVGDNLGDDAGEMTISIVGSSVAQLWVSQGVPGTLTVIDSRLVHAWNGSDLLEATVRSSGVHGLVNFMVDDLNAEGGSGELPAEEFPPYESPVIPAGSFRRTTVIADYLSDPSQLEDRLLRWSGSSSPHETTG